MTRRAPLAADPRTTAYRLVHGAADGLPGVAVDRYGALLVLHLADPSLPAAAYADALRAVAPGAGALYVKRHPPQASRLSEAQRAALAPDQPAWGEPIEAVEAREHGVRYEVRPAAGLSVGLFLDMRDVRAWLRQVAADHTVLNLFAYTCSFGVCATLGGARRVLNLDLSKSYLDWGQRNYARNGLETDPRDFVFGEAFDWLRRLARRGERFDLLILDPPSYSTARGQRFAVERDYHRLVAAAAPVVTRGGLLLAATNHASLPAARFEALIADGLAQAGRRGSIVGAWHEPEDFPVSAGAFPYLKVRSISL